MSKPEFRDFVVIDEWPCGGTACQTRDMAVAKFLGRQIWKLLGRFSRRPSSWREESGDLANVWGLCICCVVPQQIGWTASNLDDHLGSAWVVAQLLNLSHGCSRMDGNARYLPRGARSASSAGQSLAAGDADRFRLNLAWPTRQAGRDIGVGKTWVRKCETKSQQGARAGRWQAEIEGREF